MIGVYNPPRWPSARLLVEQLKLLGCDAFVAEDDLLYPESMLPEKMINWGFRSPACNALNAKLGGNKLKELQKLTAAEVCVPELDNGRPFNRIWDNIENRYRYYDVTMGSEWLPRHAKHSGGRELVRRLTGRRLRTNPPDFFVKRMDFVDEYRVHVINGKSVKIGKKVKMHEGAHPWVRSHRYGWRPSYTSDVRLAVEATPGIREESKKAIAALNLDFGAVDVGVTREGRATVLEVNTAPGLKPSIAQIYAEKLKEMLS